VGRMVRSQICGTCAQPFPARQVVDGKLRSLYGRRSCLSCSAYGTRQMPNTVRTHATPRARAVPGRDEWLFRSVRLVLAFLTPQRAPLIARTGLALFTFSLLLPMFASPMVARPSSLVIAAVSTDRVAASTDLVVTAVNELPPLPDPIARGPAVTPIVEEGLPPTPQPAPVRVAAVPIEITAVPASASGSVVTASWYGPGFFENRLPCWQWLAANGLPIQFLPDTWGVAHKSLPCGTMVTLTHGASAVTVPVVDRGPYIAGREFDLSPRVKAALGCTDLCTVVMHIR
jgi:rare lipoprotein A (RlpA)-like double-psi beta-barrel protein